MKNLVIILSFIGASALVSISHGKSCPFRIYTHDLRGNVDILAKDPAYCDNKDECQRVAKSKNEQTDLTNEFQVFYYCKKNVPDGKTYRVKSIECGSSDSGGEEIGICHGRDPIVAVMSGWTEQTRHCWFDDNSEYYNPTWFWRDGFLKTIGGCQLTVSTIQEVKD